MSPAALYRSLAIYELCERLGIRKWKHLSTSHIRAVLPLPPHEQERMLRSAEMCRMTVRQLEQEVGRLRPRDQVQGGRPRLHRSKTIVKHLEKCLESLDELLGTNGEADMSPEAEGAVHRLICRIRDACAKLEPRTVDATLEQRTTM
jgi:HTH domain found in ParB protein